MNSMCTTLSFREGKGLFCPNFSLFFYSWIFFVLLIPWNPSSLNAQISCQPTASYHQEDLCDGCGVFYTVGSDTYDQENPSGSTTLPGANWQGCDSIVHVNLNFHPNSFCYHTKTFCIGSGDVYIVGGDVYDESNPSGLTLLAGANEHGCDSIVHVTLIYTPPTEGYYTASFCQNSGDDYTVGGDTYNEANPSGSTLLPGANQYGCDSTVHVTLTYYPGTLCYHTKTFCVGSGGSYTAGGTVFDESNPSGIVVLPGANQYGCDSTIYVTLTFNPTSSSDYAAEFCEGSGGSYTVGTDTYNEANPVGSTILAGANYLDCDSTVNVVLTFNPATSSDYSLVCCQGSGETVTVGTDVYNEANPSGSTTLVGANQYGCDSTVNVVLTFNPTSSSDYAAEFCEGSGGSYTVGTDTYNEASPSGSTTLAAANQYGCDSTVNVVLTFNPATSSDYSLVCCQGSGETVTVGTDVYNEANPSGSTTLVGANQYGCDSTVNVVLTFNPTSSSDYAAEFCTGSGGSYTVGTDTYNEASPSGSTTLAAANQYGCDSTVNVVLTFNPTTSSDVVKTFCEGSGATYTVGGDTYSESNAWGYTTLSGANQYGCDSIIQVDLIFLPNSSSDYSASFCEGSGDSYTVGTDTYNEASPSGSTTLAGANYLGCDSTVNVVLTFNPATSSDYSAEFCAGSGDSYTVGTDTYNEANPVGSTILVAANQYGCDSTVNVILIFNPTTFCYHTKTFCVGSGGSYTAGGTTFDESNPTGIITLPGANQYGCDSTIYVTLTFNPSSSSDYTAEFCEGSGGQYMVGWTIYNEANPSGSTTLANANWQGCDSIVNVLLTFNPASSSDVVKTFCEGSGATYTVGGDTYSESNAWGYTTLPGANQYGCDSIVQVDLIFLPNSSSDYAAEFCEGSGGSYTVGTDTYNEANPSGSTTLAGANYLGCDSTVNVVLTFNPASTGNVEGTYCKSENYSLTIGGDTYDKNNPSGSTTLSGANQYGCDSTVYVNLTFLNRTHNYINTAHCKSDNYSLTVGSHVYDINNPSGNTNLKGANYQGCDSIVHVNLTFLNRTHSYIETEHCKSDNYSLTVGSHVYDINNPSGNTNLNGANYQGCDSIVHVNLTFLNRTHSYIETAHCKSDNYSLTVGSHVYDINNPSGNTNLNGANYQGCDSIVHVNLTFLNRTHKYIETEHCENSAYSLTVGTDVYDINNTSGNTNLKGANYQGCDSIVHVNLTFNPTSIGYYTETFCEGSGGSYTVGGFTYDEAMPFGNTILLGANQYGCDSTVQVTLTFNPNSESTFKDTLCDDCGVFYVIGGDTYDQANPVGSTTLPGANYLGCDSTIHVILTFLPNTEGTYTHSFCEGSGDSYTVGGDTYDEANPSGFTLLVGANQYDCDSIVNVILTFLPNSSSDYADAFCEGDGGSYTVGTDTYNEASPSGSTTLVGANYLGCDSTVNVVLTFNPATDGYYTAAICDGSGGSYTVGGDTYNQGNPSGSTILAGANQYGCDSTVHVTLTILPKSKYKYTKSFCEGSGGSFTVGGDTYNEANPSGATTLPGANDQGCDSIVLVTLTFLPNTESDYTASFCTGNGDSYTVGGDTYNEASPTGSTTLVGANYLGCDSTVNVTLTFLPTSTGTYTETFCEGSGGSYTIGTDTYDETNYWGFTTLPNANQYGCDSIVQVDLIFLPNSESSFTKAYCEGSGAIVTVGTDTYNEASPNGSTTLVGANYLGCDSTVHVTLVFNPASESTYEESFCSTSGGSYTVGGDTYDQTKPIGSTLLAGANQYGCDSTVHVTLTFLPNSKDSYTETFCEGSGGSYTVGGDTYNEANPVGATIIVGGNSLGCDSTIVVTLIFLPNSESTFEDTLCNDCGVFYVIGGDTYDQANPTGSTTLPGANWLGCDSTVHVILTFLPNSEGSYTETFCEGSGGSYTVGGDTYNEANPSGFTLLEGVNQYGCDSVVTVTLIFNPASESTYTNSFCVGENGSYTVGGDTYDETNPSGSTLLAGANQYGCDSTVHVTLTFNPTSSSTLTETFCQGSGATVTVGTDVYDETNYWGTTTLYGANQYGCDSTVQVDLTFLPNSSSDYTETFCEGSGGSYTVGTDTYNEASPSGSTTLVGANYLGCDSTVNVILIFNPPSESYFEKSHCNGCGVFYQFGNDVYDQYNTTGSTTLPGANQYGCDSTIHVNLIFLPNTHVYITDTYCEGSGSSITVGTVTYDESNTTGTTVIYGGNYLGCDSIVHVDLSYVSSTAGSYEDTFCKGSGDEYTVGGDTYNEGNPSGMTTLSNANWQGCDSIVNVTLTYSNNSTGTYYATFCQGSGESYTIGGDTYDETNYWGLTTIPNAAGCDSTVYVDLTFEDCNDIYCTCPVSHWGQNINYVHDLICDPAADPALVSPDDKLIVGSWNLSANCINYILPGNPPFGTNDVHCGVTYSDVTPLLQYIIAIKIAMVQYDLGELSSYDAEDLKTLELDDICFAAADQAAIDALPANIVTVWDLLVAAEANMDVSFTDAIIAVNNRFIDCTAASECPVTYRETETEIVAPRELKAFPNPATNLVNVQLSIENEQYVGKEAQYQVTNVQGKVIMTGTQFMTDGMNQLQLNTERLPSGMYIVTLNVESLYFKPKMIFIAK